MDSTVLLHLLAQLAPGRVRALHVDHGLHPDSRRWAEHCRGVAAALGVPVRVLAVRVRPAGRGPEAAAREARYAALAAELAAGEALAVAHHREDQVETVWLRARRGAGVDGLGGMPERRSLGAGLLWRPLLDVPRSRLHAWARARQLCWIEDPQNLDLRLARVHARRIVLPALRRHWPELDDRLLAWAHANRRLSARLREAGERLAAQARQGRWLRLDPLREAPPVLRAQALRAFARNQRLPPFGAQALARIERELLDCAPDRLPQLDWHGWRLVRWRDGLCWLPPLEGPPPDAGGRLAAGVTVLPGDAGTLDLSVAPGVGSLSWRFARGSDRIRPAGDAHHRRLKQLFQQAGWPPWLRRRAPLLLLSGRPLMVPGLCRTALACELYTRGMLAVRWHCGLPGAQGWTRQDP